MKERHEFKYKIFALILLFTTIFGNFSAFAQTKPKPNTPKCSGAWTGNITFTRTQTMTDNKVTPRVSGRGKDTRDIQMKYDYKASVAVIEAPEKNGSSIGKATINSVYSMTERTKAEEENSCDRGKSFKLMTGNFTNLTEISRNGSGEANVSIGVNSDGTYSVGVGLPQISGKTSGSQSATYSGQCSPKQGNNIAAPTTPATIQGASFRSNGTNRVDPGNPNKLSGSWSETALGITNTITWSLQKCGGELRISDLKFEAMKFPNWDDWQEITEQKGTIDGNFVKIKAKVLNTSGETKYADVRFKETYKGDKWDGARPDAPLKDNAISVRVDAGEEKDVEMVWDSSGYAWFDDGRPRLLQRIKAELEENDKKIDEITKNLKVAPKPVVLVHGLWSNWQRFQTWQNILTTVHSYDWKAFPVGENIQHGWLDTGGEFLSGKQGKTVPENARQLKSYIEYAQKDRNAWHVDVVAHSTGGLIARHYINSLMPPNSTDGRPQISHLLMLGTPNLGSPCADLLYSQNQSLYQATTEFAQTFNRQNSNRKGVRFSALAGNPLPTFCYEFERNDGFVTVPSAKWTIKDTAESESLHTDLTGTKDFSDFVRPHLAIGPKGDHNPEIPDLPNRTGQNNSSSFGAFFTNASYKPQFLNESSNENKTADGFYQPDFAKAVKLSAKQSVEIEIPVETAQNFGLSFMARPEISATLFNDKGVIVGKNLTNTPEANAWFRSIYYNKPTVAGTWKLKLENTSDQELEAILATWKDTR